MEPTSVYVYPVNITNNGVPEMPPVDGQEYFLVYAEENEDTIDLPGLDQPPSVKVT